MGSAVAALVRAVRPLRVGTVATVRIPGHAMDGAQVRIERIESDVVLVAVVEARSSVPAGWRLYVTRGEVLP